MSKPKLDKEAVIPELGAIIKKKLEDNSSPLEFFLIIYPQDTTSKNVSYISPTPTEDLIWILRDTANMFEADLQRDVTRTQGES